MRDNDLSPLPIDTEIKKTDSPLGLVDTVKCSRHLQSDFLFFGKISQLASVYCKNKVF